MMSGDYVYTFESVADSITAYRAASDPRAWWGEMIVGESADVGDRFIFNVPGRHYSKFEVTESVPGKRVIWKVIPSGSDAEAREWLGTEVVFEFSPRSGGGSVVTFTHRGLTPELECHDVCSAGWRYHLTSGLQALLDTGAGVPLTTDTVDEVVDIVSASMRS